MTDRRVPSSIGKRCELVLRIRRLTSVWGYHFDPGSNGVDVSVRRLRAKLGPDAITTIRGVGYRFDAP